MTLPLSPITPTQFVTDFPEFSNTTKYPPSAIQFWLNYAYLMLDPHRWRTMLNLGAEMFAGHNLVIEAMNADAVAQGGEPGISTGLVASVGAGGVSVSYDTGSAINPQDTHWNLTTYGTRFAQMMRDFGAGGLIIHGGGYGPRGSIAWP